MMTNTFAAAFPGRVAAIAPVSGGWLTAFGRDESLVLPAAPMPVWVWRGSDEDFATGSMPRDEQDAQQLAFWIAANGADASAGTVGVRPFVVEREGRFGPIETAYEHATQRYDDGAAPVWFTEVTPSGHQYQPGAAERVWAEFFGPLVVTGSAADVDGDGAVDVFDLIEFLVRFASAAPLGDVNRDGLVDVLDLIDYLVAFASG